MSLASVTAQQNNALAVASTAGSVGSSSSSSTSGTTALGSLSSNFNDFLQMLMTQLQNQDPTSPMDTNEFTSELVEFSGVEQQINTNTSLTQLIQLTQAGEVMQASAMTGKQVTVSSDQIPLQNSHGTVQFTTATAEPVDIQIFDSNGNKLSDNMMMSTAGTNTWTWNGTNSSGATEPDGSYKVAVVAANAAGATSAVTTSVIGTATGVQTESDGTIDLELGALTVPFTQVQSVGN
jgi:flagellar basal-body rod modification protein FlgD